MSLQENLSRLLKERELSMHELAMRTGVAASHIGLVRSGKIQMPRGDILQKLAKGLGVSVEDLISDALDEASVQGLIVAEAPAGFTNALIGTPILVPLVEENVAAGRGQLPIIPIERPYFFREDWLRKRGWRREDEESFVCYRLGHEDVAWSMYPTIQPLSIILVHTNPDRKVVKKRSLWLVHVKGEGNMIKRVTIDDDVVVLESDNRDEEVEEFAPRILRLKDREKDLEDMLRGRVLWYSTEVE
jgi:transcriptional regulator with XRE-family HTH domain